MENEKNIAGYNGRCPICGSGDGMIIRGKDDRFRNVCRVMGCPFFMCPTPAVGFESAEDCVDPRVTKYFKNVTIKEYKTGKKEG